MNCPLCGLEFESGEAACRGCPAGDCRLIRCPRCGYEIPKTPKAVETLKRWLRRWNWKKN